MQINYLNMIFGFQINMENLFVLSEICSTIKEKQGKKIPTYPCFRGLTFF